MRYFLAYYVFLGIVASSVFAQSDDYVLNSETTTFHWDDRLAIQIREGQTDFMIVDHKVKKINPLQGSDDQVEFCYFQRVQDTNDLERLREIYDTDQKRELQDLYIHPGTYPIKVLLLNQSGPRSLVVFDTKLRIGLRRTNPFGKTKPKHKFFGEPLELAYRVRCSLWTENLEQQHALERLKDALSINF